MTKVRVLIATFNRSALLRRAIDSVLKQDFADWRLEIVDDASTDDTADVARTYSDPRIEYRRNPENVGGKHGDIAILKAFIARCDADYCVYLCDDDYWLPADLLTRQVAAMEQHPSLAFVQGGVAQVFPAPVDKLVPNEKYMLYRFLDAERRVVFTKGLLPAGVLTGYEYLSLFAADPKNRNIVAGATLFRTAALRSAGAISRAIVAGVRWQAGYALSCGTAMQGDVLYFDEPAVMCAVDFGSASFRGTQLAHMMDALHSVDAAFGSEVSQIEIRNIRDRMAWSVVHTYVCNKFGHKFGWFKGNALGDISSHFEPPILAAEFLRVIDEKDIPISDAARDVIRHSDGGASPAHWPEILARLAA